MIFATHVRQMVDIYTASGGIQAGRQYSKMELNYL